MNFSVLMSIYKNADPRFLREAINSVLDQTLLPDEIVIIVDGPVPQDIQNTLNEYSEKHVNIFNIIPLEKNIGLALALRHGVLQCKYDLIARMDQDDICSKDRFEKQIDRFIQDEDLSMVGSYVAEFYDNIDQIRAIRKVPLETKDIKKFAKRRNPMNHMTVMFKKESVLNCGNYKESLENEDYNLWVRMIMEGCKIQNMPEPLVYARTGNDMYRRRGGVKYAMRDFQLLKDFYKMNFLTFTEFVTNILLRVPVRLLPNKLREYIYLKFLRK